MNDNYLFQIVTVPLKKLANLLFSLAISMGGSSGTNVASLVIVGVIFVVIISVITHSQAPGRGIGNIIRRIKERKK